MGGGAPRRPAALEVTGYLLDTHVFLWWVAGHPRVRPALRDTLEEAETVLVSAVSGYEIALKHAAGRMPGVGLVAGDLAGTLRRNGLAELPITLAHAEAAGRLPLVHRDPFDRLLVAQSAVEGLRLVSADRALDAFGIDRLW